MQPASLQQLLDEHRQIDDRSLDIIRMAHGSVPDVPMIDAALQDLDALVSCHLRHDDSLIYELGSHLCAIGRQGEQRTMSAELDELRADWDCYLGAWARDRIGIARDPVCFRHDTDIVLQRIRVRVRRECELLYFAALRYGLIVLRDARDTGVIIAGS